MQASLERLLSSVRSDYRDALNSFDRIQANPQAREKALNQLTEKSQEAYNAALIQMEEERTKYQKSIYQDLKNIDDELTAYQEKNLWDTENLRTAVKDLDTKHEEVMKKINDAHCQNMARVKSGTPEEKWRVVSNRKITILLRQMEYDGGKNDIKKQLETLRKNLELKMKVVKEGREAIETEESRELEIHDKKLILLEELYYQQKREIEQRAVTLKNENFEEPRKTKELQSDAVEKMAKNQERKKGTFLNQNNGPTKTREKQWNHIETEMKNGVWNRILEDNWTDRLNYLRSVNEKVDEKYKSFENAATTLHQLVVDSDNYKKQKDVVRSHHEALAEVLNFEEKIMRDELQKLRTLFGITQKSFIYRIINDIKGVESSLVKLGNQLEEYMRGIEKNYVQQSDLSFVRSSFDDFLCYVCIITTMEDLRNNFPNEMETTIVCEPFEKDNRVEERIHHQNDMSESPRELSDLRNREVTECCICLTEKPTTLFLPCRHMNTCKTCYRNREFKECPVCRAFIESSIDVFY